MDHLVNFDRRHCQPIDFVTIIAPQSQVAGRDGCHRATRSDDLEMLHFISPVIGDELFQLFFKEQAHQSKAARVIVDVIEQIAQGRNTERH